MDIEASQRGTTDLIDYKDIYPPPAPFAFVRKKALSKSFSVARSHYRPSLPSPARVPAFVPIQQNFFISPSDDRDRVVILIVICLRDHFVLLRRHCNPVAKDPPPLGFLIFFCSDEQQ